MVIRGVRLAGIGYALSQLIALATYLVLAKLLVPVDFGHFAAATIVVGVGTLLGESGMSAAVIQRRTDVEEALNSALLATLAGGTALTLFALAAAPVIGLVFRNSEVGILAAVMSGWMLLRLAMIVPDAILQRRFSFYRRVIIDPLGALAFAAGTIVGAASGLGVWALVLGTYCQAAVNVLAGWVLVSWRPRPRLASVGMWRELARFGRPAVGAELIRRIAIELPVFVLGRFVGASALGQFTYSLRVAAQPAGAIVNMGGYVLLPAFSRISAEDERFRAALLRSLRWLCVIAFPFCLLLIPLGMPAVVLVFGHAWREAGYGVMALGVFCAALVLDSVASEAWKASGRPDMLPRMHGISLVLTAASTMALVPFGLVGVTAGMSLSAVGVAAYAIYGIGHVIEIPVRRLTNEVWRPVVAAIPMVAALLCLEYLVIHASQHRVVPGLALLGGEALLGLALYIGGLAVVSPDTAKELAKAATNYAKQRKRVFTAS